MSKGLMETLKELFEEVPRNWCRLYCSTATYEQAKSGSTVLPVGSTLPSDLRCLNLRVYEIVPEGAIDLYNRHGEMVRRVHFDL